MVDSPFKGNLNPRVTASLLTCVWFCFSRSTLQG